MVKIKVDETSGVDHPSHLEEGWIVIKSEGPNMAVKDPKDNGRDNGGDNTDIDATLAKAIAERDEAIAKAAAWESLSIDTNEVSPAVRQLTAVNSDLADKVVKALGSANAQAEVGNIFAEFCTSFRPATATLTDGCRK